MSDWLHTDGEHYDRLGLLLIRFGTMFVGIWMGVAVTSLFSSIPFWLKTLAFILGISLLVFARHRAMNYQTSDEAESD